MIYKTPAAFKQALEARVQKAAADREHPMTRVRQQLVFDRFLARVFHVLGDRIAVKGGAALELRLQRARTTRDLDLGVRTQPDAAFSALEQACRLDLGDFFSFRIEPDRSHPRIQGDGIVYEGQRYRAEARLAGKIYGDRFGLDLGFGDVLTAPVDIQPGADFLAFAGIAAAQIRLYPREAHVAEKLHAYTLPRARENTRVKDLPDLALLASTGEFQSSALHRAIEATFAFRKTHTMPSAMPMPPGSWTSAYETLAARDRLPWSDLEAAAAAAKAFLDPVLGRSRGVWDPTSWTWKPMQQERVIARGARR